MPATAKAPRAQKTTDSSATNPATASTGAAPKRMSSKAKLISSAAAGRVADVGTIPQVRVWGAATLRTATAIPARFTVTTAQAGSR